MAAIARHNPDRVVVVDEAYIDFGGDSAIRLIDQHPNLLVTQTLSKSRSLAGLRVGFAVGHPDLIDALERVKNSFNSYPLDRLALAGATAAMNDNAHFEHTRQAVIATRERLNAGLAQLGFAVLPSAANFVFARHRNTTPPNWPPPCANAPSSCATSNTRALTSFCASRLARNSRRMCCWRRWGDFGSEGLAADIKSSLALPWCVTTNRAGRGAVASNTRSIATRVS